MEIRGAQQLRMFGKRLQSAADRLEPEFSKAANDALKTLPQALQQSALATLPRRGGLAREVAGSVKRRSKIHWGARLSVQGSYALGRLDRGQLLHPVYGNRSRWVAQHVSSGWFTKPTIAIESRAEREIRAALQRVADKAGS